MRDRRPGPSDARSARRLTVVPNDSHVEPRPQPWHWQFFGACRDADEALFFHPPGERGSTRRRRDLAAKSICASCPVLLACREQSLRMREPFGVWGGLSEVEREACLTEREERLAARAARQADRAARLAAPAQDAARA